jgi:hypothetical protein
MRSIHLAFALALVLPLLLGAGPCQTIPTSSDAKVSATEVTAKGGTIACAVDMHVKLDPATGIPTDVDCQTNGAFTDPPSAEETTALAKFGESLLGVVRLPFDVLAAFGRAMNPVPVP